MTAVEWLYNEIKHIIPNDYIEKFNKAKEMENQTVIFAPKKIETYSDLPTYGKHVLVSGIDKKQYGTRRWHVCEMNDLEDGVEFKENGNFLWLTEKGTKIEDVTHWCELPTLV